MSYCVYHEMRKWHLPLLVSRATSLVRKITCTDRDTNLKEQTAMAWRDPEVLNQSWKTQPAGMSVSRHSYVCTQPCILRILQDPAGRQAADWLQLEAMFSPLQTIHLKRLPEVWTIDLENQHYLSQSIHQVKDTAWRVEKWAERSSIFWDKPICLVQKAAWEWNIPHQTSFIMKHT